MLFEVSLENFKPFGEKQTAKLSNITLIYGPNSGGKSSLIQALLLIAQTLDGNRNQHIGLIPRGDLVDLGSFKSLVFRHEVSREMAITAAYDRVRRIRSTAALPLAEPAARRIRLGFRHRPTSEKGAARVAELSTIRVDIDSGERLKMGLQIDEQLTKAAGSRSFSAEDDMDPSLFDQPGLYYMWMDEASADSYLDWVSLLDKERDARVSARRSPASVGTEEARGTPEISREAVRAAVLFSETGLLPIALRLKDARPLREERNREAHGGIAAYQQDRTFRESIYRLFREFADLFVGVRYLGPLRSYPSRHSVLAGGRPTSVGTKGEFTSQVIFRHKNRVCSRIDRYFREFGIPYKVDVEPLKEAVTGDLIAMTLMDSRIGKKVSPTDVGFGIGQLLPIIVEGVVAESAIICVEQPEIHLHPRLQANVADFLIDTSGAARGEPSPRDNQWIVETHSEALILRIQRRIRERKIKAGAVSVLYVEPGSKSGSRVLQLRMDEEGRFIDEWPGGFFEESAREMFGI